MKLKILAPVVLGFALGSNPVELPSPAQIAQAEKQLEISPLERALYASGLHKRSVERNLDKFDIIRDDFLEYSAGRAFQLLEEEGKAEVLHSWFRERVGTEYQREALHLPDALDAFLEEGKWNCLTGNLIAYTLAEEQEMPVEIMEEPGHVYLAIHGKAYDITREDKGIIDGGEAISEERLVANIPYSQGTLLMKAGMYAEAIPLFREAQKHSPSHELAKKNLAHSLHKIGKDKESLQLIRELSTYQHN